MRFQHTIQILLTLLCILGFLEGILAQEAPADESNDEPSVTIVDPEPEEPTSQPEDPSTDDTYTDMEQIDSTMPTSSDDSDETDVKEFNPFNQVSAFLGFGFPMGTLADYMGHGFMAVTLGYRLSLARMIKSIDRESLPGHLEFEPFFSYFGIAFNNPTIEGTENGRLINLLLGVNTFIHIDLMDIGPVSLSLLPKVGVAADFFFVSGDNRLGTTLFDLDLGMQVLVMIIPRVGAMLDYTFRMLFTKSFDGFHFIQLGGLVRF
jgi:hypothetical protein